MTFAKLGKGAAGMVGAKDLEKEELLLEDGVFGAGVECEAGAGVCEAELPRAVRNSCTLSSAACSSVLFVLLLS